MHSFAYKVLNRSDDERFADSSVSEGDVIMTVSSYDKFSHVANNFLKEYIKKGDRK